MKHKTIVPLISGCILAILITVWHTSQAGFTASNTNTGDAWQTGQMVLTDDIASDSFIFSATDESIPPGYSLTRCVQVTYSGTWTGLTNGAVVKTHGTWSGSLAPYITLTVDRGTGGTSSSCSGFTAEGSPVWKGKLSELTTNFNDYEHGFGGWIPVSGALTKTYRLSILLDYSSSIEKLSATGRLTWEVRHPTGGTGYADRVLNDQPAAYWRLSDGVGATVAKEETNQYPGTYLGSPDMTLTGWTLSGWNNTASFINDGSKRLVGDGTDNQVSIPRHATFLPGAGKPFSLEYTTNLKATALFGPAEVSLASGYSADNTGWFNYFKMSTGTFVFMRKDVKCESQPTTGAGNRHYVVVTHDGNLTTKVYLDGVLSTTCTLASPYVDFAAGTDGMHIAYDVDGASPNDLDEVAFYRKQLSATQIANHYAALNLATP